MFSRNRPQRRPASVLLFGIVTVLLGISLSSTLGNHDHDETRPIVDWHPVVLAEPIIGSAITTPSADGDFSNCRYGAAYVAPGSENWLPSLNLGWYLTFSLWGPPAPSSEFVPVVRLKQNFGIGGRAPTYTFSPPLDYVAEYAKTIPGSLWLIGNEIEIDNDVQDNIMPDVYARAYHDAYHAIKGADPSASLGIGSVTMATPGRLQYLDIVVDTYQEVFDVPIPVDVWNFHLYILPERNLGGTSYADGKIALGTDPEIAIRSSAGVPEYCPLHTLPDLPENDPRLDIYCRAEHDSARIFKEQLVAMRQWMKENGHQNKPLIISEFGILPSNTNPLPNGSCELRQDEFGRCMYPERVTNYMLSTVEFMENATDTATGYPQDGYRLVQRWLWYSLVTPYRIGSSSNLLEANYAEFAPGSVDALTLMGNTYKQLASNPDNKPNLVAGDARSSDIFLENPGDTVTAKLAVNFRNNSTVNINTPFVVSFYSDRYLTQYIGSTIINPAVDGLVHGCSWALPDQSVEFEWSGLGVGVHPYWAKIDTSLTIPETGETDNVTTMGKVTVYSKELFQYGLFAPMIRR